MKNKLNTNQVSASGEPNVPSAAMSRENSAQTNHEEQTGGELAAAPCSAQNGVSDKQNFSESSVEVKLDDKTVWGRNHKNDGSGGTTIRNKQILEKVVALLGEAIIQASSELSLLNDGNRVFDGRFVTLPNVKSNVPVSGVRNLENDGKAALKPSAISATFAALESGKLAVCSEHDVALCVAIDSNSVPVAKILACVNELHNGVVVLWPVKISDSRESSPYLAATAGQNASSAATSRENAAPALDKEPASGELAAAPCSAGSGASEKQDFKYESEEAYPGAYIGDWSK